MCTAWLGVGVTVSRRSGYCMDKGGGGAVRLHGGVLNN